MSNEEVVGAWVDAITAHNYGNSGVWTARFGIDGTQLVERAVKLLDAVGVTMSPNGPPLEYVARFPSVSTREVVSILVDTGAWICPNQALQPIK